jgi:hypothetical protein
VQQPSKPRPKITPLNLPGMNGGNNNNNANPVAKLLSPRYAGPLVEPDPLCPHRELDWCKILNDPDLHKDSQKSVTKRKLAEIARMKERLQDAKRKYVAELSSLENQEMKVQAEAQRRLLTLKLQEASGISELGSQFFLALGDTSQAVGTVVLNIARVQPEDLEAGTTLTLPLHNGTVKIFVRAGGKL